MQQPVPDVDAAALSAWAARILAATHPAETLLEALVELDARQDLATQAALYESVCWRADVRHYWTFYRLARVYGELAREEASFHLAALAVQMQPEWDASFLPFQIVFRGLCRRGNPRAALDVFARQVGLFPENPIAHGYEIEPLMLAAGLSGEVAAAAPAADPSAAIVRHRVVESEQRPATPIRPVRGLLPPSLDELAHDMSRDAIDVAELAGGELLICRDGVAVRDAAGGLHADLSVGDYPDLIARRVLQPGADEPVEEHTVEEAVLLSDGFAAANLCHFLLDQMSRLELYRRAGVDLSRALVVGPELRTGYQRAIAARAGMTQTLGTARLARVRAARLWVSSDCRALQHPAHLAAPWAIAHARAVLGGCGAQGGRRLYVSRADSSVRRMTNEPALLAELIRHGFESIVPGTMSYPEQLAAFRSASHVVGTHGAALTHIVLCPPGARVLELFHPLYGSWAYAMLAFACGLDYAALCGRDGVSDAPGLNDPAQVDMTAGRFGERHLRVDPAALRLWLDGAG